MPPPSAPGGRPDAERALAQYRQRANHYDLELAPFEPVRQEAVAWLGLHEGDTVLDVGCGTGLSFGLLKRRVGAGRIVGIDPCPEMLARARERVRCQAWEGVELLQSTAAAAALKGRADAALFHFTHDVLQDARALDHILSHLRSGASVVAAGLQWAPAWCLPVNVFVLGAALYSVTSLAGLERPWKLLAERVRSLEVRTREAGAVFIARGVV